MCVFVCVYTRSSMSYGTVRVEVCVKNVSIERRGSGVS